VSINVASTVIAELTGSIPLTPKSIFVRDSELIPTTDHPHSM
jgi:hypothetical protein